MIGGPALGLMALALLILGATVDWGNRKTRGGNSE
ncbi:hypothetical protein HNP94_001464 [Methanococcus maripaludis]|uniref:Uncharacterized protein n=1 Tax=Methanococcus maripaludis TaxID=39152 RepID=A0A7J9PMI4_METMI|nr:hypothetical protein [Methanococcus maripaludis]